MELIHPALAKIETLAYWQLPKDRGAGILFPIRDVHGHETYQYRPDRPLTFTSKKTGKQHTLKYESPSGVRNVVYVPLRVRAAVLDGTTRLWVTEGVKKTLAGVAAGLCIVGLAGVSNTRMRLDPETSIPLPDLDAIPVNERVLVTAFDSDTTSNPNVRAAERRWRQDMEARGATVLEARIPPGPNGEKHGLDDYLAAGGSAEALVDEAIRRGWWNRPGSAPPTPVSGTDGGQTCQDCQRKDMEASERRSWELLQKRGGWSPNEAAILRHYGTEAAAAAASGKGRASILIEDTLRLTGVSAAAVTRTHKAFEQLQADPEIKARLPFIIKQADPKPGDYRKPWRIIVQRRDGDPVLTAAEIGDQLATLLRPKMNPKSQGDGRHGGARWSCPQAEHAKHGVTELVRRFFRCAAPGCSEHWEATSETIHHPGADSEDFHDENAPDAPIEAVPAMLPCVEDAAHFHDENSPTEDVEIAGDRYAVQVQGHFQRDDSRLTTQSRHAENRPLIPVAFTSRADQEAAAGERRHAEPLDQEPEPPATDPPPPETATQPCVWVGCPYPRAADRWACVEHLRSGPAAELPVTAAPERDQQAHWSQPPAVPPLAAAPSFGR